MDESRGDEKFYKFCPNCKSELEMKLIDDLTRLSCPNCCFIFWNNPKPVVSILLHKDGKILMLQRASKILNDYWVLPGGFMNYEERPEEAILREAKEEIGEEVKIEGLIGVYRIDNDPRGVHIDIIYHGKSNGNVMLSNEDKKWGYFDPKHLPKQIAYKHRRAIKDWMVKSGMYT